MVSTTGSYSGSSSDEPEKEARDWISPRGRLLLIVAFLVVWIGPSVALFHYAGHIDNNTKGLRASQLANCKRGNERTVNENVSNYADYRFYTTTTALIKTLLAEPGVPAPTLSPGQQATNRAGVVVFVAGLERDAAAKTWSHLIESCAQAVDHSAQFHLKPAVSFAVRLPPPGALEVQHGE